MEFSKRVLKVKLYGEDVVLTYPTVRKYKEFQKKIESKEFNEFDLMVEFVVESGLKKDLIDEMEPSHLMEIIGALTGDNKVKK